MTWKDGVVFLAGSAGFAVGSVSIFLSLPSPFFMAAPTAIVAGVASVFALVQAIQAWQLPSEPEGGEGQ